MSAINKIFSNLLDGKQLSTKEIKTKFKVSNPRDPIYRLRQEGFPVNLVYTEKNTRKYVLNTFDKAASTYTVVRG